MIANPLAASRIGKGWTMRCLLSVIAPTDLLAPIEYHYRNRSHARTLIPA